MFFDQNTIKKGTKQAVEIGHGSQNRTVRPQFERFYTFFSHKEVFKVKRIVIVTDSWLTGSDCMVRFGFENHK